MSSDGARMYLLSNCPNTRVTPGERSSNADDTHLASCVFAPHTHTPQNQPMQPLSSLEPPASTQESFSFHAFLALAALLAPGLLAAAFDQLARRLCALFEPERAKRVVRAD